MKNYRMGNTLTIKWTLAQPDGSPYMLNAGEVELFASVPGHRFKITDFTVNDNVVTWKFYGDQQKYPGIYTLTLVENRGEADMMTVDFCDAFCLVKYSCLAGGADTPGVSTETVEVDSKVSMSQIGLSPDIKEAIENELKTLKYPDGSPVMKASEGVMEFLNSLGHTVGQVVHTEENGTEKNYVFWGWTGEGQMILFEPSKITVRSDGKDAMTFTDKYKNIHYWDEDKQSGAIALRISDNIIEFRTPSGKTAMNINDSYVTVYAPDGSRTVLKSSRYGQSLVIGNTSDRLQLLSSERIGVKTPLSDEVKLIALKEELVGMSNEHGGEIFNSYTQNKATGANSHAENNHTEASGENAHAEGYMTTADGYSSHVEGYRSKAEAECAHAEGGNTLAAGVYAHAEGFGSGGDFSGVSIVAVDADAKTFTLSGDYTADEKPTSINFNKIIVGEVLFISDAMYKVVEVVLSGGNTVVTLDKTPGFDTSVTSFQGFSGQVASGNFSHAEGSQNIASGSASHAEGQCNEASALASHAEGGNNVASGQASHAEGLENKATGDISHAEGHENVSSGQNSHTEGYKNTAPGESAHAEGQQNTASGQSSHAEGGVNEASGAASHAEGKKNVASGEASHAEGMETQATNNGSHAEGTSTKAWGAYSHAEGGHTEASGTDSHAEGYKTLAQYDFSHAEGSYTQALAICSHAEGSQTKARGECAHAEGELTNAGGSYSHAEGYWTLTQNEAEHAEGKYNKSNTGETDAEKTIHSVGCGTADDERKNAEEIMSNGDIYMLGVGGYDGTNPGTAKSVQTVISGLSSTIGDIGTILDNINGEAA